MADTDDKAVASEETKQQTSRDGDGSDDDGGPNFAELSARPALPPVFLQFLKDNHVPVECYDVVPADLPRFVRVNPFAAGGVITRSELEKQFGCTVEPLDWLPDFYSLPGRLRVVGVPAFDDGLVYGLDASSGVAVMALGLEPGQSVLDLCCAPGAKFCMIADLMRRTGSLTGVDISRQRIGAAARSVRKYGASDGSATWRCRLVCGDGTKFDMPPPAPHLVYSPIGVGYNVVSDSGQPRQGKRNRTQTADPAKPCPPGDNSYDRVLVDAECTHDGSIKHISKFYQWGWDTFEERVMNPQRLAALHQLQSSLLANGYRLLRPGGVLVYSTCSLTLAQNEQVVSEFLAAHPDARVVPIPKFDTVEPPWTPGGVPHTVRFHPTNGLTSGLYVARIEKAASVSASTPAADAAGATT